MKLYVNLLVQSLSFVINGATLLTNIVPMKFKPYLVLIISAAQGVISWYAHQYNPDGTPATIPYVANPKKP